jgi:hypothetical protein
VSDRPVTAADVDRWERRPEATGMRSACDEYACPCHDALPVLCRDWRRLDARVRELEAEVARLRGG